MPKITFIDVDGTSYDAMVDAGLSLMEGAINVGVPGVLAICGGSCACSTCHGYIDDAWVALVGGPNDIEDATLELANERRAGSRLTCQVQVTAAMDGLVVHVAKND
ncbi:MAG: 2Fe-2S iron-sulfur cluster binding domain-containing protein [Gammaproteobacteria bacterium]|nr:2Fe-2S iron-sulfur cluster binding domain-containing protein [Gammaproteobacteria bacterium]